MTITFCLSDRPRLFFLDSLSCLVLTSSEYLPSSQPLYSDTWNLSLSPQPHSPRQVFRQASQVEKCWLAPISILNFLCFAFHAPIVVLPSDVSKFLFLPTHKGVSDWWKLFPPSQLPPQGAAGPIPIPLSPFFLIYFVLPHYMKTAASAKSLQSCPTLCDP